MRNTFQRDVINVDLFFFDQVEQKIKRSLEDVVNTHTRQGWALENVQFAMRESSKRPAMAFVFFTRYAEPGAIADRPLSASSALDQSPSLEDRQARARSRLAELAGDDGDSD